MGTINTRLARLEQQQGTDNQRRRQVEADAVAFTAKIEALAAGFDEAAAGADDATQMRWSPAQRLAWRTRFRPIGAAA